MDTNQLQGAELFLGSHQLCRSCQREITGKCAIKLVIKMHRPETKIEREVKILCNKPSPWKPMHRIKWRISETILCLLLVPSVV
jgi:hypothetical protein